MINHRKNLFLGLKVDLLRKSGQKKAKGAETVRHQATKRALKVTTLTVSVLTRMTTLSLKRLKVLKKSQNLHPSLKQKKPNQILLQSLKKALTFSYL